MGTVKARPRYLLTLDNTDYKERTCLKCSKVFMSRSPGNRICRECDRVNQFANNSSKRIERGGSRSKVGLRDKGNS